MFHKTFVLTNQGEVNPELLSAFQDYRSILIQVFAALDDPTCIENILSAIRQLLPQAAIIGASSDGTIHQNKLVEYGESILVSVTGFEKTTIKAATLQSTSDSFSDGASIAQSCCSADTKALIAFTDAAGINGEEFVEGIYSRNSHLIIAGGIASTPTFTNTFVISDNRILREGAVAVSLTGKELKVHRDHSFGWQSIGKEMTATEVSYNRIITIDNKSPAKVFRHYLGEKIVKAMPGVGSAFPLLVRRGASLIARGIIDVIGDEFIVSGNIKTGDKVYIGYGNPYSIVYQNNLVNSVISSIESPEAVYSYYCEGRRLFMPDHLLEYEISLMGDLGNVSGFFTLGEFYTNQQYSLLNFSSTILALSENSNVKPASANIPPPPTNDQYVFGLVSEGLFHLIDVRTRELEHQAYHDELTGLPNRSFFHEMLSMTLHGAHTNNNVIAVLYINIDQFSNVNHVHGQEAGDKALQIITELLRKQLKYGDIISRYRSDEFVILSRNYNEIDEVIDLAHRIIQAFKRPLTINEKPYSINLHIGISHYPDDGTNEHDLIKNASAALNEIKYSDTEHVAFYHSSMTEKASRRITMESDLRNAIENREFEIHYQPQVKLETGEISGAEALVRWNHPTQGLIRPDYFINLAEETGLIINLGEIVFDMALEQLRTWFDSGLELAKMSINVSAKQFTDQNLLSTVTTYLNKHAIPPGCLDIEITESAIMEDSKASLELLSKLQHYGTSISIDDFGTGYSSLSYLKQFKVNTLKIDKSFIDNIPQDENDIAITEAIIALAHSLNMDIVAEGVENNEHERFLTYQKCTYGQGYYYSRPLPANEFENFYNNWGRR